MEQIESAARNRKLTYECWTVVDGEVQSVETHPTDPTASRSAARLAELSRKALRPELQDAISEYAPMMSAIIARAEACVPGEVADLEKTANVVEALATATNGDHELEPSYRTLGQILTINAGLGRYAAQTFAGVPRILETECHYWSHSLLGIGVANLALSKFRRFLHNIIGDARIPQRVAAFRGILSPTNLLRDAIPEQDYLYREGLTVDTAEEIVPLISFYSSRDGYRSTQTTLSAPLACVAGCNSSRWSLLTVTIQHLLWRCSLFTTTVFQSRPQAR